MAMTWLKTCPIRPVVAIIVACAPATLALANEDFGPLRRWAIIASSQLRDDGLADLALVRLTEQRVELVEREQLDQAIRELDVSAYSGSQAAGKRLKLGQSLKADALLLLSTELRNGRTYLKLVISESGYGARLHVDFVAYSKGDLDAAVLDVVEAVGETRKRFTGGIQRIVGVSPFVSKNLEYRYDSYQTGIAYLLEDSLARVPGVAVIETEEAQSIRRETARSTVDHIKDRVVPVLVEGEFTVSRGESDDPLVEIEVRINGHASPQRTIRHQLVPISRLKSLVRGPLVDQILELSTDANRTPISSDEQFRWLVARADVFANVGSWKQAVGLREAAILLEPSNAEQRQLALRDHKQRFKQSLVSETYLRKPVDPFPGQEKVDAYLAQLRHIEYLIRNRLIDRSVGLRLVQWHVQTQSVSGRKRPNGDKPADGPAYLAAAENERRKVVLSTFPLALRLKAVPSGFDKRWPALMIQAGLFRIDRKYRTAEDLEFLRRVLTEVMPDIVPIRELHLAQFFEYEPGTGNAVENRFSATEYEQFLQQLIASEHQVASFYGRLGLLRWQLSRLDRSVPNPQGRSMLAEADQLLELYETMILAAGNLGRGPKPLKKELIELHYQIYRTLTVVGPTTPRRRVPRVAPNFTYGYKPPPTPDAQVYSIKPPKFLPHFPPTIETLIPSWLSFLFGFTSFTQVTSRDADCSSDAAGPGQPIAERCGSTWSNWRCRYSRSVFRKGRSLIKCLPATATCLRSLATECIASTPSRTDGTATTGWDGPTSRWAAEFVVLCSTTTTCSSPATIGGISIWRRFGRFRWPRRKRACHGTEFRRSMALSAGVPRAYIRSASTSPPGQRRSWWLPSYNRKKIRLATNSRRPRDNRLLPPSSGFTRRMCRFRKTRK